VIQILDFGLARELEGSKSGEKINEKPKDPRQLL
jgi:hypothetical protein